MMDEHPRMPIVGPATEIEALIPFVKRMQSINWIVKHCLLVFDDNSAIATQNIVGQSRGRRWYAESMEQSKRPVIQGSVSVDKSTGRIKITIHRQGFNSIRVLAEEVFHIVFEIIQHTSPGTFRSIKKWYVDQLRKGLDPTWHMYEVFAALMMQEEKFPGSTDLPPHVIKYAHKVFSTTNKVPDSAMEMIMAVV